jgi:predicted transcriptional regulator
MSFYGAVMDVRVATELPRYSADVACAVLIAIDAAGFDGADPDSLARESHFAEALLQDVLRDLRDAGLTRRSADGRYRVTPLGEQVLLLAGR